MGYVISHCPILICRLRTSALPRLGLGSTRRINRISDDVAGDHHLNAPVPLTSSSRIVRGDRLSLAKAAGGDVRRTDALLDQESAYGICTSFRQHLVVIIRPDTVGMALDFELQARMSQDDSGNLRELFTSARLQIEPARIEENIGHIDDQSPRRIAR